MAAAAHSAGIRPKAYMYVIMLAASSNFSTPVGYQTNMMVAGPGGYRFADFARFGLPLQLVCAVCHIAVCYHVFA